MRKLLVFFLFTSLPMLAATISGLNGGPIASTASGLFAGDGPGPFVASNLTCTGQNCGALNVSFLLEENGSIYRNPFGYNLAISDGNGTVTTTSSSISITYTLSTSFPDFQSLFLGVSPNFMGQTVTSFLGSVTDSAGTVMTTGGFVIPDVVSGNPLAPLQITETIGLAPLTSGSASAGSVGTEFFVPEPGSVGLFPIGLLVTVGCLMVGQGRRRFSARRS